MWNKFIDNKLLIFVPFGYSIHTRIRGLRDQVNNAATAWITALILIAIATPDDPWSAFWKLPLSYICFIAFYELGYLYNDTLGMRGETNPRLRLTHDLSKWDFAAVIGIRIVVFATICGVMGWYQQVNWLAFYAVLGVVIVLHNTTSETAIRLVTFFQMSLMRFTAPIFVWLPANKFVMCLLAGADFFHLHSVHYLLGRKRTIGASRAKTLVVFCLHTPSFFSAECACFTSAWRLELPCADDIFHNTVRHLRSF